MRYNLLVKENIISPPWNLGVEKKGQRFSCIVCTWLVQNLHPNINLYFSPYSTFASPIPFHNNLNRWSRISYMYREEHIFYIDYFVRAFDKYNLIKTTRMFNCFWGRRPCNDFFHIFWIWQPQEGPSYPQGPLWNPGFRRWHSSGQGPPSAFYLP